MHNNDQEEQKKRAPKKKSEQCSPESMSRKFQGIWVDKEIWFAKDLNMTEKMLLAEIDSLCVDEKQGCTASNDYLAKFFGLSKMRIQAMIAKLEKLRYVTRVMINESHRKLFTHTRTFLKAPEQNAPVPHIINNTPHIMDNTPPHIMDNTQEYKGKNIDENIGGDGASALPTERSLVVQEKKEIAIQGHQGFQDLEANFKALNPATNIQGSAKQKWVEAISDVIKGEVTLEDFKRVMERVSSNPYELSLLKTPAKLKKNFHEVLMYANAARNKTKAPSRFSISLEHAKQQIDKYQSVIPKNLDIRLEHDQVVFQTEGEVHKPPIVKFDEFGFKDKFDNILHSYIQRSQSAAKGFATW